MNMMEAEAANGQEGVSQQVVTMVHCFEKTPNRMGRMNLVGNISQQQTVDLALGARTCFSSEARVWLQLKKGVDEPTHRVCAD